MCRLYRNSGSLKLLEPEEPVQPCNGLALLCGCENKVNGSAGSRSVHWWPLDPWRVCLSSKRQNQLKQRHGILSQKIRIVRIKQLCNHLVNCDICNFWQSCAGRHNNITPVTYLSHKTKCLWWFLLKSASRPTIVRTEYRSIHLSIRCRMHGDFPPRRKVHAHTLG